MRAARAFAAVALTVAGVAVAQGGNLTLFPYTAVPQELEIYFQPSKHLVKTGELVGVNVPVAPAGFQPYFGVKTPPPSVDTTVYPASSANISKSTVKVIGATQYALFLIDPDAPTPSNPTAAQYVHYIATGLRLLDASTVPDTQPIPYLVFQNSTQNPPFIPYAPPTPPSTSPPHRYIAYLFVQPANFSIPVPAAQRYNASSRAGFKLADFAQFANFGNPVASNYFLCSNQSTVPPNSTGGGNGTSPGQPGSPTATTVPFTGSAMRVVGGVSGALVAGLVGVMMALL